jgi:membrane protease YdiL (CAAX protease family)
MNTTIPKYGALKAILTVLLTLAIQIVAIVLIVTTGIDQEGITATLIICFAFIVVIAVGLLIVHRSVFTFREIGFRRPENTHRWLYLMIAATQVFWLIPLLISDNNMSNITPFAVVRLLIYMTLVAISEELVYRGLLYRYLLKSSIFKAITFSAFIFGIAHVSNAFAGLGLIFIVLNIVYAFVFGWAAVSVFVVTKSLWPVIVWHFADNFILNVIITIIAPGEGATLITTPMYSIIVAAKIIVMSVLALRLIPQIKHLANQNIESC